MDDENLLYRIVQYVPDLNDVLAFRLLGSNMNRKILQWLSTIPFKLVYGRRTMISTKNCDICKRECDHLRQITYPFTGDYNSLVLMHCDRLFCRLNAIRSMNAELRVYNIYILRKNLPLSGEVEIPRSKGGVSMGVIRKNHVYKVDHAVYLGADWIENDTAFQKLVPMKNYMDATQLQHYENHLLLSSVFVAPVV